MKLTPDKNILIVGLGLIGGSYAKALTKKGYRVSAITRSESTVQYALDHGIIAAGSAEIDPELIGQADIVVLALYPHVLLTWLEEHPQAYDLGECEFHLAFQTDDYEAAHKLHEEMGCICYENPAMGIYFITDPDGYWLEVVPVRK